MTLDTNYVAVFRSALADVERAAIRLKYSYDAVQELCPLTIEAYARLSEDQLQALDALSVRYARYQDLVGKAFQSLTFLELEPKDRFLDVLAAMEKRGLVSMPEWADQRHARNVVHHTYVASPKAWVEHYNQLIRHTEPVLAYADRLRQYAAEKLGLDLEEQAHGTADSR